MYDTEIISEAELTSIYQYIISANNSGKDARKEHTEGLTCLKKIKLCLAGTWEKP